MAALSRRLGASYQQVAKRLDFLGDEIAKRSHARCPPHVAVKDEIVVEGNRRCRAEQPEKIGFLRGDNNWERSKTSARLHREDQGRRRSTYSRNASIGRDGPEPTSS